MRGYLLVSNVDHAEVSLPRLRTIHGDSLIGEAGRAEEAALLVTLSSVRALKMPSLRDGRGMQAHCYRPAGQARVRLEVLSVAKNSIVPFQRNVSCVSEQTGTEVGTFT